MARLKRSTETVSGGPRTPRLLSVARDLQRRKGRERRSLFLVEGVRAAEEVVRARVGVSGVLVSPQLEQSARGRALLSSLRSRAAEVVVVSPRELAAVSGTDTPQGVLLIAEIPARVLDDAKPGPAAPVLLLDGVQDPGNAGTILRTAAALGAAAVVALPGTVDLWNPKVVRGAMGAHFQIPVLHCETDELFAWLDRRGVELWAADAAGEPLAPEPPALPLAIALGNEGAGVSAPVVARSVRRVALPIEAGVESLNVAVAAGIILYALRAARNS